MLFKEIALEWYEKNRKSWVLKTQDARLAIFNNHIFPILGDMLIKDIKPAHILVICQKLETEQKTKTERIVCQIIKKVFSYAVIAEYIKNNPATDVLTVCQKHTEKHHPFLPVTELQKFFTAINQKGRLSAQAKRAFLILFFTTLRSGEVMKAKWSEIDLANKTWTIPAERMKMREKHIVPLSDIVIRLLNEQKQHYPSSEFIFPSPTKKNKAFNAIALSRAIHHAGYGGQQVLHGFRHIFATYCYESNKWRDDAIETCLAHKINGVRGVYNKAKYTDERRKLMQWYAHQMTAHTVAMLR